MRLIVLDASVAVKWYIHEEGRDQALALLADDELLFVAPDIFLPEVVNAVLRHVRDGDLDVALFDAAVADLHLTSPELISSARLMEGAVQVAQTSRHPLYDCLYLALAERWETELVTADAKFVTRCRETLADDPIRTRLRMLEDESAS